MSSDLERELHEALHRLPAPRAPRSLTPRVMAAVRARREAPWYARPMTAWPMALQALATVFAALPLAVLGLWLLGGDLAARVVAASGVPESLARGRWLPPAAWELVEQASAVVVLWRVLLGPVLVYAAAVAVAVGCVFAVCAAALTRVVLGRMPAQAG